ncbi:MAG: winged helix-turn-helix transcriptional regulator [Clostridia bacterium]|nr:winged helix-turn-helix transcriptional regulator [Clostridia bacterium]
MTRVYLLLDDKIFADMLKTELSENGSVILTDAENIITPCALITDADNVGKISLPRENCHVVVIESSNKPCHALPPTAIVMRRPFETEKLLSTLFSNNEKTAPKLRSRSPAELICYDGVKRTVSLGESTVKLSKKEYALFEFLFSKRGSVVARGEIFNAVWGGQGAENVVDVYVCYLREKLEGAFGVNLIKTHRGKGYVFEE